MKTAITIAAILALAACSGKPLESADNKAAEATANEMKADAAIQNVVATQGPAALAPGVPISKPATNPNILPAGFQGRWGMTTADCDFSRSDAKGLLTIRDDTLNFYESTGKVTAIKKASANALTAKLDFKGEGQSWATTNTLSLTAAGTALLRTERSPVKTYRYERC